MRSTCSILFLVCDYSISSGVLSRDLHRIGITKNVTVQTQGKNIIIPGFVVYMIIYFCDVMLLSVICVHMQFKCSN